MVIVIVEFARNLNSLKETRRRMHNIIQNRLNCIHMNQLKRLMDDSIAAEADNRICPEFEMDLPSSFCTECFTLRQLYKCCMTLA
jgi:hypothetical protein